MSHSAFRTVLVLLLLTAAFAAPMRAQNAGPQTIVVLKSGEILKGVVERQGERYCVHGPASEVRVKLSDVDFLCSTLDEAYRRKQSTEITGKIEDHLRLAQWCLRQELLGYAARELSAAMEINPNHPGVGWLDRKLAHAQSLAKPVAMSVVAAAAIEPAPESRNDKPDEPDTIAIAASTHEELDRMVRELPKTAVESFTITIQPLLMNNCSGAGCHGPTSTTRLSLQRIVPNKNINRRATQRNLQSVLKHLDHESPGDSRLLQLAVRAHGGAKTAPFQEHDVSRYRQLIDWVSLVTQPSAEVAALNALAPKASQANVPANSSSMNTASPTSAASSPAASLNSTNAAGHKVPKSVTLPAHLGGSAAADLAPAANGSEKPPALLPPGAKSKATPLIRETNDPFDPEVFNRRFGKQQATKSEPSDKPTENNPSGR